MRHQLPQIAIGTETPNGWQPEGPVCHVDSIACKTPLVTGHTSQAMRSCTGQRASKRHSSLRHRCDWTAHEKACLRRMCVRTCLCVYLCVDFPLLLVAPGAISCCPASFKRKRASISSSLACVNSRLAELRDSGSLLHWVLHHF